MAIVGTLPDFQASHDWDVSWPRQGCYLIFRHFWGRCAGHVQVASWPRQGRHVRDASWPRKGRSLIFRHFWARCAGHVWDMSWPRQERCLIFRHFWAVSGHGVRPCPRHLLAMAGMLPDFQANSGHGV
ncbi:Hypothetical predicted protein [Olea europaea subsp. europaea]|uniref:Uncharacterized protein n=1 Tax=Olea europaea subsp. europaea TaxID=158383 RepID=A0A8S0SMB7_OLEEU|nr:Hypothetical predicted protein [Olea europaea subsp. europaea]